MPVTYNYDLDVVPVTPINFMHSLIQKTQVTLTWTSSPTDIVNMYTISYIRIGGCPSAPQGNRNTTLNTTITRTGLEESMEYVFSITATNSVGNSPAAEHTLTTLPDGNANNFINKV